MTMTAQGNTLVFKDQAGDYYLLPQGMVERARVSGERKAEVERLVAEANADGQDDTQGHFIPLLFLAGCAAFGTGAALSIGFSDLYLGDEE